MKNLWTIAPHTPFLDALAGELWRRAEGDAFRLSETLILLPTRRACRALGQAFARLASGKPVLLPRLQPLGDADEDELALSGASFADAENFSEGATGDGFALPPALSPLRRLLILTRLVQRRDPTLSCDQAAGAAAALGRLLDQIQTNRCDIARLPELVQERELAAHWQQTLAFLEIVTQAWPEILAERGCLDSIERRNRVLAAQAALWRATPPVFPIIAAGSTGSTPATAELLDAIASLPQGAVILPGLDRTCDDATWDALGDTHPQHAMKNLLAKMGVARGEVRLWGEASPAPSRARLLAEAMRPAALTETWQELSGALDASCCAGLTRLALESPQEEAQVIALRLRAALEAPERTALLVTGDRDLARRTAVLLQRWGIAADDSGGAALPDTPLGAFLSLLLAAATPTAGAADRLALLKHPLAACGLAPAACRARAREAEIVLRRAKPLDNGFAFLDAALAPLREAWDTALPFGERVARHIRAAEAVAATDLETGMERLWRGDIGLDVAEWLAELRAGDDEMPPLTGRVYADLFAGLARAQSLRVRRDTHPRLAILGPLEARLATADLVILGGMNEGVWPPDLGFDPWMSRPMRKDFGLPAPEFRVGLAAHDFVQLASAREVMITRATRSGGTPTTPSRFILQIEAVLRAAGLADDRRDALAPPEPWAAWARALDAPQNVTPCARPHPCPPVAARPMALSVTEISTWRRNPYAIYARHVLGLKKLDDLDAPLDASDRGTMIHEALEKFLCAYADALPPDALDRLLALGREAFARGGDDPRVGAFWWARFTDIAAWFVAEETTRRAKGLRPLRAESAGTLRLGDFLLSGRADRIDRAADGSLVIVDYKTGRVPDKGEVENGIEPQLPLLALMAARGAFTGVPATASARLEYWKLSGGRSANGVVPFDKNLETLIAHAESGLNALIAAFAEPHTTYEVTPRPRFAPRFDDYAHLARCAEWGREEGGET